MQAGDGANQDLQCSSPDYKKLEADILKKQGDLNLKVKLQQKDFMEQEGRVYYGISREIDDAVRLLAARYNIVLVLRFTGDEVDPSDRNDILRGINKSIVYYDKRMDITAMVLGELNRSGPPQQTDPAHEHGAATHSAAAALTGNHTLAG